MQINLDNETFKKLYLENKTKDLAAKLGVSEGTIIRKAHSLGLKKPRGRAKHIIVLDSTNSKRIEELNKELCEISGCKVYNIYFMEFYVNEEPDRLLSAGFAPLEGETLEQAVARMAKQGFLDRPINITNVITKPVYIRFEEPSNFIKLLKLYYESNKSYSFVFNGGQLEAQLIHDSIDRCKTNVQFKESIKNTDWTE